LLSSQLSTSSTEGGPSASQLMRQVPYISQISIFSGSWALNICIKSDELPSFKYSHWP
jgi:hypothetical protein